MALTTNLKAALIKLSAQAFGEALDPPYATHAVDDPRMGSILSAFARPVPNQDDTADTATDDQAKVLSTPTAQ